MFKFPINTVELKDVPIGDVFECEGTVYMKTNERYSGSDIRCVVLSGYNVGWVVSLVSCAKVKVLDVTMTVEE